MEPRYLRTLLMYVLGLVGLNNSTTYSRRGRWSAGLMAKSAEKLILHKCRQCNRTDRRPWSETDLPRCKTCESAMDPLEIRYKCLRCGHLEWVEAGSTGKSCRACGYRIFVKPRKGGRHKVLKAE